jgi:hypothetical protein
VAEGGRVDIALEIRRPGNTKRPRLCTIDSCMCSSVYGGGLEWRQHAAMCRLMMTTVAPRGGDERGG